MGSFKFSAPPDTFRGAFKDETTDQYHYIGSM